MDIDNDYHHHCYHYPHSHTHPQNHHNNHLHLENRRYPKLPHILGMYDPIDLGPSEPNKKGVA